MKVPTLNTVTRFVLLLSVLRPLLAAAEGSTNGAAGHWEGPIRLPATTLEVRVDLDRSLTGAWSGTIDIPVQGLRGFKLEPVVVEGRSVRFSLPDIPGDPLFVGRLDEKAGSIAGDFTQGGQTFPFALERKPRPVMTAGETPSRGVPGKGLAGHWQGSLKPAPVIELRLALEITNTISDGLAGTMVNLDQGGARIPLTSLHDEAGRVHLEAVSVGGVFEGALAADGAEIAGEWKQRGQTLPLVFKRLDRAPQLNRPQEPVKPHPYQEEEVRPTNAAAGITLAGTLTLPRSPGPHPAVVLISGSGPQDRDAAIMGHRPFLVLADHLTRQGIAVLRCDDRGVGQSQGDFGRAIPEDFDADALAAVEYLRGRPEVDRDRIGLIGHSEGGLVAPRAAVKSPGIAFIVLLAGAGVRMDELLVRQSQDIARVMGLGEEMIATNTASQREIFHLVRDESDATARETKLRELARRQVAELTPGQRQALGLSEAMIEGQIQLVQSPWFRQLLAYDPRPTLEQVRCPVLALNGERDLQVAAKDNLPAIHAALAAGGNHNVKTVELPGLNHLFQTCQTGAVAEYGQIEETFAPAALKLISGWILEQVRR